MIKLLSTTPSAIAIVLLSAALTSQAQDASFTSNPSTDSDALLINLGAYLGFDLTAAMKNPYSTLFNVTNTGVLSQNALQSLFGAIPVNAMSDTLSGFIPNTETYKAVSSILNEQSNKTFEVAHYNTPSNASGSIAVNALIDQENYQNDPINQAVLNILGTPDYTYCMNNDQSAWLSDCNYLYNLNVMSNVLGPLPTINNFFSFAYNEPLLSQLNSNTLIAPLLYDTSAPAQSGSSNSTSTEASPGLTATNQIQNAANFIRYATYGVNPNKLPSLKEYGDAYATAISTDPSVGITKIVSAQQSIMDYFTSLRSYAAQASVPISNLYYILSKRMPQPAVENNAQSSEALNEFIMASNRLNVANSQKESPWITQINTASPATVSKEIAILLAEMNYQLYLNRQIQERQLLTESLLLMATLKQQSPEFTLEKNTEVAQ